MIGAALAIATVIAMTASAGAQAVVIVNGDPVTQFDVEQRSKLIQISTHKTPTRNEVVEELINEKLKIQLLRRFSIDGSTGYAANGMLTDVVSGRMMWTAKATTPAQADINAQLAELARAVVGSAQQAGLF
jgi:peptidyl-prolyl cis-trans isomerase SurA